MRDWRFPYFPRRVSGFTLVELLVVIAVVAILAGLALPMVNRMQAAAKNSKCVSNLRQIGSAIQLFANDYDGLIVPGIFNIPNGPTVTWVDALAPYILKKDNIIANNQRPPSVFACPEEKKTITPGNKSDYGLNIRINASGGPTTPGLRRMLSIPRPSKTIIVADSMGREIANWSSFRLAPRHKQKANVMFLDMHIESIEPSEIHPMGEGMLPWVPVE